MQGGAQEEGKKGKGGSILKKISSWRPTMGSDSTPINVRATNTDRCEDSPLTVLHLAATMGSDTASINFRAPILELTKHRTSRKDIKCPCISTMSLLGKKTLLATPFLIGLASITNFRGNMIFY